MSCFSRSPISIRSVRICWKSRLPRIEIAACCTRFCSERSQSATSYIARLGEVMRSSTHRSTSIVVPIALFMWMSRKCRKSRCTDALHLDPGMMRSGSVHVLFRGTHELPAEAADEDRLIVLHLDGEHAQSRVGMGMHKTPRRRSVGAGTQVSSSWRPPDKYRAGLGIDLGTAALYV